MPVFWDADLLSFAWVTCSVIFGRKVRAQQNKRAIPVQLEFQEIPDHSLTKSQSDYIKPVEEQLAALNYYPECTYKVTNVINGSPNLVRRYSNPADSAACALTIVEVKVKVKGIEAVKTSSHVSFRTRFSDGNSLNTRNMSLKTLFDHPPESVVQECRQIMNLAELKRRHDSRAAQMGSPLPPPSGSKAIFDDAQKAHHRFAEFQLQRGLYQLLPDGNGYEVTDKTRLRGVWNHFNPFARRMIWSELAFSAMVGAVLPLLAILKVAPMIARNSPDAAVPSAALAAIPAVSLLVIALFYCLAGVLIGIVSDWAPYYWIFLISYVPTHAIAGWSFGWFPFSALMFVVSAFVIRARHRRSVIFNSGTTTA